MIFASESKLDNVSLTNFTLKSINVIMENNYLAKVFSH